MTGKAESNSKQPITNVSTVISTGKRPESPARLVKSRPARPLSPRPEAIPSNNTYSSLKKAFDISATSSLTNSPVSSNSILEKTDGGVLFSGQQKPFIYSNSLNSSKGKISSSPMTLSPLNGTTTSANVIAESETDTSSESPASAKKSTAIVNEGSTGFSFTQDLGSRERKSAKLEDGPPKKSFMDMLAELKKNKRLSSGISVASAPLTDDIILLEEPPKPKKRPLEQVGESLRMKKLAALADGRNSLVASFDKTQENVPVPNPPAIASIPASNEPTNIMATSRLSNQLSKPEETKKIPVAATPSSNSKVLCFNQVVSSIAPSPILRLPIPDHESLTFPQVVDNTKKKPSVEPADKPAIVMPKNTQEEFDEVKSPGLIGILCPD